MVSVVFHLSYYLVVPKVGIWYDLPPLEDNCIVPDKGEEHVRPDPSLQLVDQ